MGWQRADGMARALAMVGIVAAVTMVAGCARVPPSQIQGPAPSTTASPSSTPEATAAGLGSTASALVSSAPASTASAPASAASSGTATPSASASPGAATQLSLTSDLTREILGAAAAFNKLPVTAYRGLMPGMTYLARDAAGDIWVGTALEPSSTSIPAQVSVQDNGSYLLLRQASGSGTWTVHAVGLATPTDCAAVGLPLAVSSLWGWAPTACRPGNTA